MLLELDGITAHVTPLSLTRAPEPGTSAITDRIEDRAE
jgi:hypothetical protein